MRCNAADSGADLRPARFRSRRNFREAIKIILDGAPLVRSTVDYPHRMIYEGIYMAIRHMADGRKYQAEEIIPSELVTRKNASEHYYLESIY